MPPPNIQVNQADNASNTLGNHTIQSETSIAISGLTIVVGYNDTRQVATAGLGGLTSITGFSFSNDGGSTFIDAGQLAPAPGFINLGDPALVVDGGGNFYFASMAVNTLDEEEMAVESRIAVSRSTSISPSVTFGTPVLIQGLLTTGDPGQDKPLVAADTSGGPFHGTVYVAWTEFASYSDLTPRLLFTRSTSTSPLAFATPIALTSADALNSYVSICIAPICNMSFILLP